VRTFGIDLASQPKNTAICLIDWQADRAAVVELARGTDRYGAVLHDKRLMHAMVGDLYGPAPAMTSIDAPLGWPTLFSQVITNQADWPDSLEENPPELLRRATDLFVADLTGKQPLAVTTERIAYAAIRANRILGRLQRAVELPVDRSGMTGVVCETYPDAALRRFGLWPESLPRVTSYKDKASPAVRERIVKGLLMRAPWLTFQDADPAMLHASDDCLDALLCALVARACAKSRTIPPGDEARARVEGWIHLPADEGVLEELIRDGD
jgi:predicted RNase H-like nuclease